MLKVLKRVFNVLYPDRRPDWEQKSKKVTDSFISE